MADPAPNTPAPAPAPAPSAQSTVPSAQAPTKPVLPPDVLDEKTYAAQAKAGLKVHTRSNHALTAYGSVDIIETTASSPDGAQILAVVRYVKTIDQKILDEVAALLDAARAKAVEGAASSAPQPSGDKAPASTAPPKAS